MSFVAQNFQYPEKARKKKIEGKVYVSFVIDTKGRVNKVKLERGTHKDLDNEALRIIKLLPNMIPAQQRGKPVNMRYTFPFNFRLK